MTSILSGRACARTGRVLDELRMHATTVARKHFNSSDLLPFRQRQFFEQGAPNGGANQPNFGMPASAPWPKLAAAMTTFEPVAMSLRALSPLAIRSPFA